MGICELKTKNSAKIKEGLIYIIPLEDRLANRFAKELMEDMEVRKRHDSKK